MSPYVRPFDLELQQRESALLSSLGDPEEALLRRLRLADAECPAEHGAPELPHGPRLRLALRTWWEQHEWDAYPVGGALLLVAAGAALNPLVPYLLETGVVAALCWMLAWAVMRSATPFPDRREGERG